ncbi:DUF2971 domain-containing protein [Methanobacterium formicicum]|nr:DUF2971 domain-containing protein [Methanobacterium formicicum]MDH2658602.1 DUF2971 domain-containing protein [Methanobacterium formicicum]
MASKDLDEDYIRNVLLKHIFDELKQRGFKVSNKEFFKLRGKNDIIHHLAKFLCMKTKPDISLEKRDECIKNEKKDFKEGYLDFGLKNKIHVTCFSETYESILMWSHYSDQHKGFCVEYDFKELGLDNQVTRFIFPVIYQEAIFDMKDYMPDSNKEFDNVLKKYMGKIRPEDILKGLALPQSTTKANNMAIFYNALIKSKVWAYEKEWRYVFPYKNVKYKSIYLPVPKPKAIYLGAMADIENSKKIIEIGKEKNISVYKMQIKPSEFKLESNIILKR